MISSEINNLRQRVIAAVLAILLINGCQSYHPKPLTRNIVKQNLLHNDIDTLAVNANRIKHPILKPVPFNIKDGLNPDEAAILAVLVNPQLKAERDKRKIAQAQVIQAGLLPNPQISFTLAFPHPKSEGKESIGSRIKSTARDQLSGALTDAITGGQSAADTSSGGSTEAHHSTRHHTACSFGIQWDITSLITLNSKKNSADTQAKSIDLQIAWKEWQIAQSAKMHLYHLIYVDRQLTAAQKMRTHLKQLLSTVKHNLTIGYVSISDLQQIQDNLYQTNKLLIKLRQQQNQERLILKKLLGVDTDTQIPIQKNVKPIVIPHNLSVRKLANEVENHRLDLLALKMSYESQQQRVQTEILNQFPKITIGFLADRDTDRIRTAGFGVNIDLPIFDRNQGNIAQARAKRQQIFDEYIARVFESENQIVMIITNIDAIQKRISLERQSIDRLNKLAKQYRQTLQYTGSLIKLQFVRQAIMQKQINLLAYQQKLTDMLIALELASGQYLSDIGKPAKNIRMSMRNIKK